MSGIVLLTGATGFVGRYLLQELTSRGCQVRAIVRKGKEAALGNVRGIESLVSTPDLFAMDTAWWASACENVDTVIHAAWYVKAGQYLTSPTNLDCLVGTLQLAKGAAQAKVSRFVGIGTCFEYDLARGVVTVETPLRPRTPYAATKASAFMALAQFFPYQEVKFAWCRLFYLYGDGEHEQRLVPYLHRMLKAGQTAEITDGDQVRDFLDVREAARMVVEVALSNEIGGVNICSGIPITVRQLAEQVADHYGRRDLLRFGSRRGDRFDPPYVVGAVGKCDR